MHQLLTIAKAYIFRITHIANLPWILSNGIHCANSKTQDPSFVAIGHPGLITRRSSRNLPTLYGGTLADYVPFYFTPRSPMLLNIKTGWQGLKQRNNNEIVILVSSIPHLVKSNIKYVFSDRHAVLAAAQFYDEPSDLSNIDWAILQNSDFKRDDNDLGKVERYQAEALVKAHVPVSGLLGIGCHDSATKDAVNKMLVGGPLAGKATAQPKWYF